jgi:hypothetical protein
MSQLRQMNLEVKLDDQATFNNFYAPKGSSQQLAKFLLQESGQQFVCIVGNSGSGLSHLLQAACQQGPFDRSGDAIYLPLKELKAYQPGGDQPIVDTMPIMDDKMPVAVEAAPAEGNAEKSKKPLKTRAPRPKKTDAADEGGEQPTPPSEAAE